jgi:hypothetical protein
VKVLVVGSLPPPASERARSLLAEVVRLRSRGDELTVLSPTENTVAHRHIEIGGPAAAIEVALAARAADQVVVQIEPGFLFNKDATRSRRTLGLGALATALRSAKKPVVLRLHSTDDLAGGPGGRAAEALWALATTIEVGDEETRSHLQGLLSPEAAAKLTVSVAPLELGSARTSEPALAGGTGPEELSSLIRLRSAGDRAVLSSRGGDDAGSVPLLEWVPVPGAGVPDWGEPGNRGLPGRPLGRRVARGLLQAAEATSFTRPLARSVRIARRLAKRT